MTPPLRSLLFCPATAPRPLAKLPFIGADAVAIDLATGRPRWNNEPGRARTYRVAVEDGPVVIEL